jgi:hypothetical protein
VVVEEQAQEEQKEGEGGGGEVLYCGKKYLFTP